MRHPRAQRRPIHLHLISNLFSSWLSSFSGCCCLTTDLRCPDGSLWVYVLLASIFDSGSLSLKADVVEFVMVGNTWIIAVVVVVMAMALGWGVPRAVEAQQFSLVHRYAHLEGSPGKGGDQGMSPEYSAILKSHDRRRLANIVNFPLRGDNDMYSVGMYYTQITLGTPPRQYYVLVDTGSDVLWLNCAPCPGCPLKSGLAGVTLTLYDPAQSSTVKVLGCREEACTPASQGSAPTCTSTQACAYFTQYGDGSSTRGYFINDVMTFQPVGNSTNTTDSANVYFGCGTTQTGNLLDSPRAVDGLIGFGPAKVAVSTQLADLGKVGRMFAHCLQGDTQGGGALVVGNILETNITYTSIVPEQYHYTVGMQNIAVNGINITTAASFEITAAGGGVIMDSGTTLSYLAQPAYDQFVAAIEGGAPVPSQRIPDSSGSSYSICWAYTGDIASAFPSVKLFFNGRATMDLAPTNYLYELRTNRGSTGYCLGWLQSASQSGSLPYTVFGGIVLKDQLVVYDNDNNRVGWRPFDCTKAISVSAPNSTTPMSVLPGSSSLGSGSRTTRRFSTYVLSFWLTLALSFL